MGLERNIPILACLFMRRFATHSTRVAPELSTQLRIVFSLISVRLFEENGIWGWGEHLELYHRGGIEYVNEHEMKSIQPGFVSETTLWLYKVLVYSIRLLSSFLRTAAGGRKWTSRTRTRATVCIAASPIKTKLSEILCEGLLWRCFSKADCFCLIPLCCSSFFCFGFGSCMTA